MIVESFRGTEVVMDIYDDQSQITTKSAKVHACDEVGVLVKFDGEASLTYLLWNEVKKISAPMMVAEKLEMK